MAKKGISNEEKLQRIARFFSSKPEVYVTKELEKKVSKACGVSPMIVDDLVKQAVDENMIRSEKLGNINVYWLFAKETEHFYACEIEKVQMAIQGYLAEAERKREHLERLSQTMEKTEGREELVQRYAELDGRAKQIERNKMLAQNYSAVEFEQMASQIEQIKTQINGVTDDIFSLKGYVCNKLGLDKKDFDRSFGLGDGIDYVE